ncbi:hypothetical protein BDN71DRAFT_1512649 [Pleurotus eryngii]|uniref:Uncharacterized protein n=1 Tax=Pleurotus eryngii TaxID=5323 RepID=A0A9P6DAP6_PLEER|nr:hypothetical protein BDN71DRAFT_1512649 [Pleurotus eryngii]
MYDTYDVYDTYDAYDTYDTYDTYDAYDVYDTYDAYDAYDTYMYTVHMRPTSGREILGDQEASQAQIGVSDKGLATYRFVLIQASTFIQPLYTPSMNTSLRQRMFSGWITSIRHDREVEGYQYVRDIHRIQSYTQP